jgi:L-fuconolactonase
MQIDSHQHFWRYRAEDLPWIDDSMPGLRRDFLPADLEPLLAAAGISGCIAVQAQRSEAETRWLLQLAEQHSCIRGVVGWADLCAEDVGSRLQALLHPRLCGVREILQAMPDEVMAHPAFRRGLAALRDHGLVYDVLVYGPQLPSAHALCEAFPEQPFVLDHMGKPQLRGRELGAFARDLERLAALPNVACKLSGLATEADWSAWQEQRLLDCMALALDAFGPGRLLFGSDWPVCLLAIDYHRWVDLVHRALATLPAEQRAAVLGGNALRIYCRQRAR